MALNIEKNIQRFLWSVIDFFYKPFRRVVSLQFFRYGFCGGVNMCFDWVLYFVFYHFVVRESVIDMGFVAFTPHIAAFVFKFPITFFTGFWLSRHVSFSDSRLRGRVQIFRYLMVVCGCILINYGCLKFFVEICHFYPTPSNILTSVISVAFSYFSNKNFSFKS